VARSGCWTPSRFIAIIAEKPKAAEKIALALGYNGARARKLRCRGIPYWVIPSGRPLVVVSTAGHLYGPHSDSPGYPVLDIEWKPLWLIEPREKHLRRFYEVLRDILPRAEAYVNACDYDIEGSVIGYMIIMNLGDVKRAYRMKFSSLAPTEIRQAYRRLSSLDWDQIEAGLARHELDWLWGINISRALMDALRKTSGKRLSLSAGRVQSPTLIEAVRRWRIKNLHIPEPRYSLTVKLRYGEYVFTSHNYGWRPSSREEAKKVAAELRRVGRLTSAGYRAEERTIRPPPAFNLGDLQAEAARLYGFSPMKTQEIAEDLYLEALISYPRTNSQKLPPTINYRRILEDLARYVPRYRELVYSLLRETRGVLRPVQGRKEDPAHPAIHPTGMPPKRLSDDEAKIYDLVVRRFLAAFARPARIYHVSLTLVDPAGRVYRSDGVEVVEQGWLKYYIYMRPEERVVPRVPRGASVAVVSASFSTTWSRETVELSKSSLVKWMESVGIGTEGTRARIVENLFRRGYLESRGNRFVVTPLGEAVASIIEELFPDLATPSLTRVFEEKLDYIRLGKASRVEVISEARETIVKLINRFNERIGEVGGYLAESIGLLRPRNPCILCGRRAVAESPVPLCRNHYEALKKLRENISKLASKLSTTRVEALKAISRRSETGKWILDIVEAVLARREFRILLGLDY